MCFMGSWYDKLVFTVGKKNTSFMLFWGLHNSRSGISTLWKKVKLDNQWDHLINYREMQYHLTVWDLSELIFESRETCWVVMR